MTVHIPGSLANRLWLALADSLLIDDPASAPGLMLTVAVRPETVQAGQALRFFQVDPAGLARHLEAVIDAALTDLAAQQGARPAALRWSVTVQL